jgi:hypothetical protein
VHSGIRHIAPPYPAGPSRIYGPRRLRRRLTAFVATHPAWRNRPSGTFTRGAVQSRIVSPQTCAPARCGRWREGLENCRPLTLDRSEQPPGKSRLHVPLPSEDSSEAAPHSRLRSAGFSRPGRFARVVSRTLATRRFSATRDSRRGFPHTRPGWPLGSTAGAVARPPGNVVQRGPENSPATGKSSSFRMRQLIFSLISAHGSCQATRPRISRGYCLLFHASARLNSPSRFFPGVHAAGRRSVAKRGQASGGIYRSLSTRGLAWDKWVE